MSYAKTLAIPACRESIVKRIGALTPRSSRRWGKMSAHEMLCHLADSYRSVIGEREISMARRWIPRPILKWLILDAPSPWSTRGRARPEIAQDGGGTPPTAFERDRSSVLAVLERFCVAPDSMRGPHPHLGPLNREEWMRWGYLHADLHLRQFGV